MSSGLQSDPRAPGLLIGEGVVVSEDVRLGAHVVIHAGTSIAPGCAIEDHAVLGKRPRLSAHSQAAGASIGELRLHAGVSVGTGAVLFAGATVGAGAILGDQCFLRERSVLGAGSVLGQGTSVDNDVEIGERVRVQGGVYLTAFTLVEDDVFVGPGVITTNDDSMGRHGPERPLRGPQLRRACRIGAGAVLRPGVEIGSEAVVAAGAVVIADVPARAIALGVPARVRGEVGPHELLERWR